MAQKLTYLALGDSYTIGEAVPENARWPVQLSEKLQQDGIPLENPDIIAVTGWTTDELIEGIAQSPYSNKTYDVVSLLIGVNNQYRGYPVLQYESEFIQLLDKAIAFAGGDTTHVFVVSIPDYGVTPFAKEKKLDPEKIKSELHTYNDFAQRECEKRGIPFFNITPISLKAAENTDYVASDGLHPSGKMYTAWVDLMYPGVKKLIESFK